MKMLKDFLFSGLDPEDQRTMASLRTVRHPRLRRKNATGRIVVLFLLLFVCTLIKPAVADCDGNHCCYNGDCGSRFCAGGHGVNCKCKRQWFAGRRNTGQCQSLYPNGRAAYHGDYNSCQHRNGICGYCGPQTSNDRPCSTNSDCTSGWCNGETTFGCRGTCKSKVADGGRAFSGTVGWDYNSCISGQGQCGYCGHNNSNGLRCSANSDCRSGWCRGQFTANCQGFCENKVEDGGSAFQNDVGGWDYNSCRSGYGQCGHCGPDNRNGLRCSAHSDCNSGYCDGGEVTAFCGGTCKEKIADNEQCPMLALRANDGVNEACRSGECMEMLRVIPTQSVAYCRPDGGFLAGVPCVQDADCSDAGRGHWCNGGAYNKLGTCELCPENCSNGCHACDNDVSRLNCGRSNTWDKIGCAGEVAAVTALEFVECLSGVDVDCVSQIASGFVGCATGDCRFQIGGECLSLDVDFEDIDVELFEDNDYFGVSLNGKMNLNIDLELTIEPLDWSFSLKATSTINNSAQISMSSSAAYSSQSQKRLAAEKKIFRKVFMLYAVPVLVEIDVTPMMWVDLDAEASFTADMNLSGLLTYEQTLFVDIDAGRVEAEGGRSIGNSSPLGIDSIEVEGNFNAETAIRVGPRIEFSVYKVPLVLDIAGKIGANADLSLSAQAGGSACINGSAALNAGVDARVGASFAALTPIEFAREACEEATGVILEGLNVANMGIDKAQCFTDIVDIDTDAIDDAQETVTEAMNEFVGNTCDAAIDFLIPDFLEEFSNQLTEAVSVSSEWASVVSMEAGTGDIGFCASTAISELSARISNVSSLDPHALVELEELGTQAHESGLLGMCEGDCDSDAHCRFGLICFQRAGPNQPPGVPGCRGDAPEHWDYCTLKELVDYGPNAHERTSILGLCEGDCDNDAHCGDGLRCFQRNDLSTVPGCRGEGLNTYDYCIPATPPGIYGVRSEL